MQKNKINWGIIGAGRIAHTFAEDMKLSPNGDLYGVASRDLAKAKVFAEKHGAFKSYGSYKELVLDPNIDVVYIATTHPYHFENTLMCLENGKHVLCEKPMGMDAAQVKQMIQTAASQNLFLMEAMWTRFIPATEKMLELLGSGRIGEPLILHADFGFKSDWDPEGRLYNKKLGGGSLMDIGIYPIYLSLLLWGVPKTVKAMARMTDTGVDSYCSMLFDYEHKAKAILESTFEAETPIEAIIYGETGTIQLHRRWHHATKITVTKADGYKAEIELPYQGNGYLHEIEEVNQCVNYKLTESSKMPHRMSLNLIKTIDRVKEQIGLNYND